MRKCLLHQHSLSALFAGLGKFPTNIISDLLNTLSSLSCFVVCCHEALVQNSPDQCSEQCVAWPHCGDNKVIGNHFGYFTYTFKSICDHLSFLEIHNYRNSHGCPDWSVSKHD